MAKKLLAALGDTTLFLQEWLANPQRTGAVAPSSPKLAAAMARWLPSNPESYVLELGPGTGAVTEALLERGLREDRLVAIENNPKLARLLRHRFPHAHIITGDAWKLDDLLRSFPACHC
jgi:phosphatidylethanolamine/phosphatidyl-N-methylethanolamine N-methyltransferase